MPVMDPLRNYPLGPSLQQPVILLLMLLLTFLPSESVRVGRKMVIGSRPPECENKCMSCKPCTATLVIPSNQLRRGCQQSYNGEADRYYLLSWKCRCTDKIFPP